MHTKPSICVSSYTYTARTNSSHPSFPSPSLTSPLSSPLFPSLSHPFHPSISPSTYHSHLPFPPTYPCTAPPWPCPCPCTALKGPPWTDGKWQSKTGHHLKGRKGKGRGKDAHTDTVKCIQSTHCLRPNFRAMHVNTMHMQNRWLTLHLLECKWDYTDLMYTCV